jgi:hypothetical protein
MSFAESALKLDSIQVFTRALPAWCRENGINGLELRLKADGSELNIGVGLPPEKMNDEIVSSILERVAEEERLMTLQLLVDEMRNVGVSTEILDPMIIEATELAQRLHPGEVIDPEKFMSRG